MEQVNEKPLFEIEFVEQEQDFAQKASQEKKSSSNGVSNPRYYEEVYNLKQAKQQNMVKYGDLDYGNLKFF